MKTVGLLSSTLLEKIKRFIALLKLSTEQLSALILGLPMIAASSISKEPLFAGSLFIALMIMMFKEQLTPLFAQINSKIKLWQIFAAFILAAVFVSQCLNPVNAFPSIEGSNIWQQQLLATEKTGSTTNANAATVEALKLMLVAANLLLTTVLFLAIAFIRRCWASFSQLPSNNSDKH